MMKRITTTLTAMALCSVFTLSSIVPAEAMSMPAPLQQVKENSDVQNVKIIRRDHRVLRPNARANRTVKNRRTWRGNSTRSHYRSWRGHRGLSAYRPGYRRHNGLWYPLATFTTGVVIGTTVNGGGGSHVRWCRNRYASYRVSDNTFQPYSGPRRECVSP